MKVLVNILLSVFVLSLFSCSSGEKPKKKDEQKIEQTLGIQMPPATYKTPSIDRSEKGKPEGSPFMPELLQDVFPLDAGGLNRFSVANGAPKLVAGQIGSQSRMVFKNPNQESEIALTIIDSGTNKLTMDQIAFWIKTPVNRQSEKEVEKTDYMKGFPSYTRYVNYSQTGEIHLLVNKRFEVVINGVNVSLETLEQVMENWDLSSLY